MVPYGPKIFLNTHSKSTLSSTLRKWRLCILKKRRDKVHNFNMIRVTLIHKNEVLLPIVTVTFRLCLTKQEFIIFKIVRFSKIWGRDWQIYQLGNTDTERSVDRYRHFKGTRSSIYILKMKAEGSSQTLAPIRKTAWCNITENSNLNFLQKVRSDQ